MRSEKQQLSEASFSSTFAWWTSAKHKILVKQILTVKSSELKRVFINTSPCHPISRLCVRVIRNNNLFLLLFFGKFLYQSSMWTKSVVYCACTCAIIYDVLIREITTAITTFTLTAQCWSSHDGSLQIERVLASSSLCVSVRHHHTHSRSQSFHHFGTEAESASSLLIIRRLEMSSPKNYTTIISETRERDGEGKGMEKKLHTLHSRRRFCLSMYIHPFFSSLFFCSISGN